MRALTGWTAQSLVHSTPLVPRSARRSAIQPIGALSTAVTSVDALALRRRIGSFLDRQFGGQTLGGGGPVDTLGRGAVADAASEDAAPPDLLARLDQLLKESDERSPFVFVRFRRRPVAPPPPSPTFPTEHEPRAEVESTVSPSSVRALTAEREPGAPLAEEQRAALEPLIGTVLKDVRIHTGPVATATAQALGAEAFTIGQDIFFRQGRFEPSTRRGQALLAHELAHVGQQVTSTARDRPVTDRRASDASEAQAEAIERMVLARDRGGGGMLGVQKYVRNYTAGDGKPISHRERERLDAISLRALEVCERALGSSPIGAAELEVAQVQVDVRLDLDRLTDEQAAEIWGHALAAAIRRQAGTPSPPR